MMTPTLQDQTKLNELYRYVVFNENGKVFMGYDGKTVRNFLASRLAAGRLIFHRDESGEIDGVMAWYRFERGWDLSRIERWDKDDEDGGEIFILAAFADNDKARRVGILRFIAKEPDAMHLPLSMFRDGKRREYSQKLLARLLK